MAFIPRIRKTLELSRAVTALHPQRTPTVPCVSRYVHAALPSCPGSYSVSQLPSCPLLRRMILTKAHLHQQNINPMHEGGHCPKQSHQGWLLDTVFIPDTQSLQQPSPHGSVPAVVPRLIMGEAFCLCPSGTALAGQSPAILLYTFSSRQQDAAFQCHGIPLKTRVRVQFCRSSQRQLIQTLQKSSPFNYFGSMGENNTYWSYGDSLPASNITCSV